MLLLTVNTIFAFVFFNAAAQAARHGWPLLQAGWQAIRAEVRTPGWRQDVYRRRAMESGGRFLLGGLAWLLVATVGAAAGGYCGLQAIRLAAL